MKSKFTLKTYLAAALAEGIISLLLLALIPGDPKNVWLIGLSKSRVAMLAAGALTVAAFALLVIRATKDETRRARLDLGVGKILQSAGHLTTGLVFSLAGFVGGVYFLFIALTTTDIFIRGYFVRLAPWVFWLTAICGQTLLFLYYSNVDRAKKYFLEHGWAMLALLVILSVGLATHLYLGNMDTDQPAAYSPSDQVDLSIKEQDIYLVYREGQNLLNGENPYARAANSAEIRWNQSLPTYLPIIYYASWLTQRAGIQDLEQWLNVWRGIFLFFNLSNAYLLFYIPTHRYNAPVLGIFAALFWLFNRWTLHVTSIYHFNFIPIFFFLLSLSLLPKHKILSFVLFGLSLGIKHNAIFMLPIYLIWAWQLEEQTASSRQTREGGGVKRVIAATLAIASIPFLASLPFLILNLGGFIKSLSISLTRFPETHLGVLSLDALFGWIGIPAKIPMLVMILLVYLLVWRRKLGYFAAGLLVMTVFVDFHSVLFRHYMAWVVPLIPLTICEVARSRGQEAGDKKRDSGF